MLINPASLYSGGNVRLDTTPYLRMAMQQRYKKQALDEASTQYFTKLPEKLNTAGVRTVDMDDPNGNGGIQKDIENWQSQWATNKDNIKRGGLAQQDFLMGFEKIRQKIQASKDRAKTELSIGKESLKPNGWKPRQHDHPIIESLGRSIYDPQSKKEDGVSEYGLNDLSLAAAPYTPQYQLKHDKVISGMVEPDRLPTDNGVFDPVAQKVTYNYGYTPEKVHQIVQTGLGTLKSDKTMYYAMEDALQDPAQVELASKYLQEDYDRTHKDGQKVVVDTAEEMYAGLQMAKFLNTSVPKTFNDQASIRKYQQEEWNRRNAITFKQRQQLANLNDRLIKGRQNAEGEIEIGYPTNELGEVLGKDKEMFDSNGKSIGNRKIVYADDIPVGTLRSINPKDINKGINPVKPMMEKQLDGSYKPYYEIETDVNGNIDFKGANGKRIGAEDARNNFIKEVVPTKVKLKTVTNKPTETPKKAGAKTIKSTVIKSLVGKKGYEGYTEKELMDYYKSNGYNVE